MHRNLVPVPAETQAILESSGSGRNLKELWLKNILQNFHKILNI